jgi:hypothetical protein
MYFADGQLDQALPASSRAVDIMIRHLSVSAAQRSGAALAEQMKDRNYFTNYIAIANASGRKAPDRRPATAAETFRVAQMSRCISILRWVANKGRRAGFAPGRHLKPYPTAVHPLSFGIGSSGWRAALPPVIRLSDFGLQTRRSLRLGFRSCPARLPRVRPRRVARVGSRATPDQAARRHRAARKGDRRNDFRGDQGAAVHLVRAMYHLTQSKGGISSIELGRRLGVTQTTAWKIKHKLMQAMMERDATKRLTGRIEIDDAYLGGERNGGKRGRGSPGKTPIAGRMEIALRQGRDFGPAETLHAAQLQADWLARTEARRFSLQQSGGYGGDPAGGTTPSHLRPAISCALAISWSIAGIRRASSTCYGVLVSG